MTDRTHHDEPEEARRKVRVTDRRRVREGEAAPVPPEDAGAAAPAAHDEGAEAGSELEAARREAAEYLDHLRRLQADFDNYRKRTTKQHTRDLEKAAEPFILRLLEVLDEFELALMAAEQKPDFEKFLRGVELVYAKLVDSLRAEGLQRIEAEGARFDPERHEALMGSAAEGDGDLVVTDVLRQGYTLRGNVIRAAGVRVAHEDD